MYPSESIMIHFRPSRPVCAARLPHGFTLIELLVVISIIAILVAILLPTLSSARETARLLTCTSQVRQFAVATQLYVNDHDGALPFGFGNPSIGEWTYSFRQVLPPYIQSRDGDKPDFWFCPNHDIEDPSLSASAKVNLQRGGSYARVGARAWDFVSGQWVLGAWPSLDDVELPSSTLAYYDKDSRLSGRTSAGNNVSFWFPEAIPGNGVALTNRHQGNTTGVFSFLDGHAESLSEKPLETDYEALFDIEIQ